MATIITVHGTFATGPEDGDGWWQRGSEFEHDIRRWVGAKDGQLHFQPFVWDGKNSELSRRAAAKALAARAAGLEKQNNNYCLVGHSHGGSVVAGAVFDLCLVNGSVKALSRWITVGTPFVNMQKRRFLLSRLGLIAKTGYLTFLLVGIWLTACFVFAMVSPENARIAAHRNDINTEWDAELLVRLVLVSSAFFAPLFLLHILLWAAERRRLRIYWPKLWERVASKTSPRWLGLWHSTDEAISGLRAVPRIAFPIFSRRFLVAPLSVAAVFLAPFLLALFISWVLGGQELHEGELTGIDNIYGVPPLTGPRLFGPDNPFSAIGILFYRVMYGMRGAGVAEIWSPFVTVGALLLTFFVIAGLFLVLVAACSAMLSALLSRTLDRITWDQLRQSAFGNDTIGEFAVKVKAQPMWATGVPPALPAELSEELSAHADRAAAKSLPKIRRAVQILAFSEEEQEKSDLLGDYLTWDELIHTAYFKVPRFRMLLAYAIAHSPGFCPTIAFEKHPDHEMIARWYEEIRRKNNNSAKESEEI